MNHRPHSAAAPARARSYGRRTCPALRAIAVLGVLAALGVLVACGAGGCSAKRAAAPKQPDVVLYVTAKGEVVADATTYAPSGANVSLDPATLDYVGRSPNKRRFYVRKGTPAPAEELLLHTGKTRYDVWKPLVATPR